MKRPFLIAGLIGAIALVIATFVSSPLAKHVFICQPGFTKPMLAMEFIASAQELQTFFGTEGLSAKIVAMEQALGMDFLFILAYTTYLIAFAFAIYKRQKNRFYLALPALAILIGLADILENGAIKMLMRAKPEELVDAMSFQRLHFFTWTKWLGLVVYFAAVIPFLRGAGRFGQLLALAAALVCINAILAVFAKTWIQPFTTGIFLIFPLTVVFCFFQKPVNAG